MQGLHLTADLYHCACDPALLIDATQLADLCRSRTVDAGLTLVAEKWHTFPDYQGQPGGVTGMLLLAESHLAIHTWPERAGVTLDVYVCNFMDDNSPKAERLMRELLDGFQAKNEQIERLQRGDENDSGAQGELLIKSLDATSIYVIRFIQGIIVRQTPSLRLEQL